MKICWYFLIILITSCNTTPIVKLSSKGLTEFHSQHGNWILSQKLLTKPESTVADTFLLDIYSDGYKYFGEGPLFTEFQNKEIIRISFMESFDNNSLFKFIKEDERVIFIEKELQQQIIQNNVNKSDTTFTMRYYIFNSTYDTIHEYRRIYGMAGSNIDEHVKIGEYHPIVRDDSRQISNSEWNALANLLNTEEFRKLPSTDQQCCTDGYNMTIEIHNANGYHLYKRQNPKDSVAVKIIQHLLELSNNQNFKELHGDNRR